ncbi:MAG: Ig-like domain-containing protein [Pseudomonadota bacterium]
MSRHNSAAQASRRKIRTTRILWGYAVFLILCGCTINPKPLGEAEFSAQAEDSRSQIISDQEAVTQPISLAEAIARALRHNLDLRLELTEKVLAEKDLELSHFDQLPELIADVDFRGRSNFSGASSRSLITGQESLQVSTSSERDVLTGNLNLTWNVLDFGVSYFRSKQTADEIFVAEEERRKVVNQIIQDVKTAYWRAVSNERLIDELDTLVVRVEQAIADSKEVVAQKLEQPLTPLTYQRELISIKRELQELSRELSLGKLQLAALMNLAPGQNFEIVVPNRAGELQEVPYLPLEMEQIALKNRSEMREVAYRKRIHAAEVKAEILELLPGMDLDFGKNVSNNRFLFNNNWISYGNRITWNLINVFRYPATKKVLDAQGEVLDARTLALAMAIMTQVHISFARYEHAKGELDTATDYRDTQREILQQIRSAAATNSVSEQSVIREEMNNLVAEAKYDIAYADLENAYAGIYASMGADAFDQQGQFASTSELTKAIEANIESYSVTLAGAGENENSYPLASVEPASLEPEPLEPEPMAAAPAPESAESEPVTAAVEPTQSTAVIDESSDSSGVQPVSTLTKLIALDGVDEQAASQTRAIIEQGQAGEPPAPMLEPIARTSKAVAPMPEVTGTVTPVPRPGAEQPTLDVSFREDDGPRTIDVLSLYLDPDGNQLQIGVVDDKNTVGHVELKDSVITYFPDGQFDHLRASQTVQDTFNYTVTDGAGGSTAGLIAVTIEGVNDAPIAVADEASFNEDDRAIALEVLSNDSDAERDVLRVIEVDDSTTRGEVSLSNGSIFYSPGQAFDTLVHGETATDSLTYTVSDGHDGLATSTVAITVLGANDLPLASDDSASFSEDDDARVLDLLANDRDPEEREISVRAVDSANTIGIVGFDGQRVTYSPGQRFDFLKPGQQATDKFSYTVSDGDGGMQVATVDITIIGANDSPIAENDVASFDEDDGANVLNLVRNDRDPEQDPLSIESIDTSGTTGRVVLNNGNVSYDPNGQFETLAAGQSASDAFAYTVIDGNGGRSRSQVVITINGANDAPRLRR